MLDKNHLVTLWSDCVMWTNIIQAKGIKHERAITASRERRIKMAKPYPPPLGKYRYDCFIIQMCLSCLIKQIG